MRELAGTPRTLAAAEPPFATDVVAHVSAEDPTAACAVELDATDPSILLKYSIINQSLGSCFSYVKVAEQPYKWLTTPGNRDGNAEGAGATPLRKV